LAKIYNIRQKDEINRLYQENSGNLKRFLLFRLKNEQDAEDILQECFIKYQRYNPEKDLLNPEGLLFKIAYTLSIDFLRKKKSDAARETSWGKENITYISGEPVVDMPPLGRKLDSRRNIRTILALIKELPPKCRQVFILHKFENLSHAQVAEQVGISRSMVEKYMMRALKKINHIRYNIY